MKRARWNRLLRILLLCVLCLSLLFLFKAESLLLKPLIVGEKIPDEFGDVIVVFGGGMRKASGVRIGYSTRERLDMAVSLYRKRIRPILVSDGSLYRKSPAIPMVIGYLMSKGVDESHIHIEGSSQTTRDNVSNTVEKVRSLGLNEMIVCTSPYHQLRSKMLLDQAHVKGYKIAFGINSEVYAQHSFSQRMRNINLIFHEYFAIAYLFFSGLI